MFGNKLRGNQNQTMQNLRRRFTDDNRCSLIDEELQN